MNENEWFTWPDGEMQRCSEMSVHDCVCATIAQGYKSWLPSALDARIDQFTRDDWDAALRDVRQWWGGYERGTPESDIAVASRDHFRRRDRDLRHAVQIHHLVAETSIEARDRIGKSMASAVREARREQRLGRESCTATPDGVLTVDGVAYPLLTVTTWHAAAEPPPPTDATHYGDMSEADVMAYLSRLGRGCATVRVEGTPNCRCWSVRWMMFHASFEYAPREATRPDRPWVATVWRHDPSHSNSGYAGLRTLAEAVDWAVEKWRRIVAASDPMREAQPTTPAPIPRAEVRHVMTGDMGARSDYGEPFETEVAGHDPTEGMSEAAKRDRAKCMKGSG